MNLYNECECRKKRCRKKGHRQNGYEKKGTGKKDTSEKLWKKGHTSEKDRYKSYNVIQ